MGVYCCKIAIIKVWHECSGPLHLCRAIVLFLFVLLAFWLLSYSLFFFLFLLLLLSFLACWLLSHFVFCFACLLTSVPFCFLFCLLVDFFPIFFFVFVLLACWLRSHFLFLFVFFCLLVDFGPNFFFFLFSFACLLTSVPFSFFLFLLPSPLSFFSFYSCFSVCRSVCGLFVFFAFWDGWGCGCPLVCFGVCSIQYLSLTKLQVCLNVHR